MLRVHRCLWLMIVMSVQSSAARAEYRFDTWTTADGLPQNVIRALHQTRDGYLWLATESGLARFDGLRFTAFSKQDTPGYAGSRFTVLWEARNGDLWAGTVESGVLRYRDGRFTNFTTKDGLARNVIARIDEDADGTIWLYHDHGLSAWRDQRWVALERPPPPPAPDCRIVPIHPALNAESLGPWCWNDKTWARFVHGRWSVLPLPPHVSSPAALRVAWMLEDAQRRLWFTLVDRPGESYRVSDGRLTVFRGLPADHRVVHQDRHGALWMTNRDGHARLWQDGRVTDLPGLRLLFVARIIEDREGTIWIGTEDQGLVRARARVLDLRRHPAGAEANFIYPLLQDRAGDVLVSSGFHGLTRLRDGRFETIAIDGRPQTSEISALFEDADGTVWVSVYRGGIARLVGGALRLDRDLPALGRVDVIHRDRAGTLWFGGMNGLHALRGGRLTRYTSADGLACDHVKALYEDATGALWIGGYGGVSRWDGRAFHSWTLADGLSSDRIVTLQGDARGTLWIGSYDGGLMRLKDGRLTRYTTKDGLYDRNVSQLLPDGRGFFWIGSARGIYRVREAELEAFAEGRSTLITSTPFAPPRGERTFVCNGGFQPAGFRARDGALWFATSDGIAVINPANVPVNDTPPPIRIERCTLDRATVDCRDGLHVDPGQESLEIAYAGLSFISPEQMHFRYKLQGLDRDWIDAAARRTAYYSHLPPGQYTFTVIGANSDGIWNETGASLAITVVPPFWRTWWFALLAGLTIVGLASAIVTAAWTYRAAQLRRAADAHLAFAGQLIASQEAERHRIAGELHDSLGQSLVIIRNQALLGAQQLAPRAPAREELDDITAAASRAIHEVREIAYNLGPYHLERLGLVKTMREMIAHVTRTSPIAVTIDLDPLDGVLTRDAERHVYRITQEALTNVVKHARASSVRVALSRDNGGIHLIVTDDGVGFDTRTMADGQARPARDAGFGLMGIAKRVHFLAGTWSIRSQPGAGTTLEVVIRQPSAAAAAAQEPS